MSMIEAETAELEGAALDWAVGKAEGAKMFISPFNRPSFWPGDNDHIDWLRHVTQSMDYPCDVSPSTSWKQCGPLIDRYRIDLHACKDGAWNACLIEYGEGEGFAAPCQEGKSALIAACRAIVASKLGAVVQVPADLMGGAA